MLFFPYSLNIELEEAPLGNLILIGMIAILSLLAFYTTTLNPLLPYLILSGWNPFGLIGHVFIHQGLFHLLANLLFMWVFGNSICNRLGSVAYVFMFFALGISAAVTHVLFEGNAAAVGASGAIYGIIGLHLAFHPLSKVKCFWWVLTLYGSIAIPSFLLIGFWMIQNIFGLFDDGSKIGYASHVFSLVIGLVAGMILVVTGISPANSENEKTIIDFLLRVE